MSTDDLRDLIDEKITTNGEQEITGAILNNVLQETVDTLADGENLDAGSIKTANIADGAITTDKIADGNVKTGKIEDHAVTKDKLDQNVSSDLDWAVASNSYYRNSQAGDVAAKVITTYKDINLIGGGSLKVTFEQANTADDATLNIDGKGAKPLYYNGARVSSTNSWEAGETVEIYYNNYTTGIYYAKRWMVEPVSVSQNTSTGHTDINIGGVANPVASVEDINITANDVCIKATLIFTLSASENYFRVSVSGDKTLMARGKYVAFASMDSYVEITGENYYIVYVDLADSNKIKVVPFANFSQIASNIVVAQFYYQIPSTFQDDFILYSAFSAVVINGVARYAPGTLVNTVNELQTLINRTANDVTLIGKLSLKSESDGLHLSLSTSITGNIPVLLARGKYICFPENQNAVVSAENYYVIYIDLSDGNKFKVIPQTSFNQVETNIVVGQFHYNGVGFSLSEAEIGYSAFSQIELDGIMLKGVRSELKYAEIGDSITYMADNKYETSYDDTGTQLTGYKGHGYGRYLAEAMGVPYANHYPQGANGRTFSEYYKEWVIDNHWSFPQNIDIWTIFLGTNDWGKGDGDLVFKQELGTIDDYKNDTWTLSNATTYGAMRKIVDKIRSLSTNGKVPKIIFITPMQRGAFVYGADQATAESVFCPSAIKRNANGVYEYVLNATGAKRDTAFTLKNVVDAIKEVCDYESFECVDWFNDSIFDKGYLNMAQTFANVGWSPSTPFGTVNIDGMRDNLHPSENGRIYKVMGKRLIGSVGSDFYDR